MEHSSPASIEEKTKDVRDFLLENQDVLVEEMKDQFNDSLRHRFQHKGFYRKAFEGTISMRMREALRQSFSVNNSLNAEEGLIICKESDIMDLMNDIIERSLG